MIHEAEESIYIQSPYFVPDESVREALIMASLSGIDVRIMIPDKPDHPFVHWVSLSYLCELLPAGVRGYLYGSGFIHAKTVVVDGRIASIGSANRDVVVRAELRRTPCFTPMRWPVCRRPVLDDLSYAVN